MSEIRKLVAILVADVVGYSQLAGADEDRTLSRLLTLRCDESWMNLKPIEKVAELPGRLFSAYASF
jgi:hypothetical protein